jgi:hypothetical protein
LLGCGGCSRATLAAGRRRSVTRQPQMGHADHHEQPRPPAPASPRRGAATHHAPTRRGGHRCRHPGTGRAHPSGRAGRRAARAGRRCRDRGLPDFEVAPSTTTSNCHSSLIETTWCPRATTSPWRTTTYRSTSRSGRPSCGSNRRRPSTHRSRGRPCRSGNSASRTPSGPVRPSRQPAVSVRAHCRSPRQTGQGVPKAQKGRDSNPEMEWWS